MKHLNEQTKQAIERGIVNYLNEIDSHIKVDETMLYSESHWRNSPKLHPLRRNDIKKVLGIINQIHHSHMELKRQVFIYLNRSMKAKVFKKSRLKNHIMTELDKINARKLDEQLLVEFQINKNTDKEQQIENLTVQLHTSQNNEQRARTNAAHWKIKFDELNTRLRQVQDDTTRQNQIVQCSQEILESHIKAFIQKKDMYDRNIRALQLEIDMLRDQIADEDNNKSVMSISLQPNDDDQEQYLQKSINFS